MGNLCILSACAECALGARLHDRLCNALQEQGFIPSKNKPDIYLRKNRTIYEYIAVYIDDLALVIIEPRKFIDILSKGYMVKLKGKAPI